MNPVDPLQLAKVLWPDVTFYRQQREIIYSVRDNNETFVVAGNMLGKDFVAAFIVLWFFLTRHPCRIVTTSTKDQHLNVLWGEIGRFIRDSKDPLETRHGGPLIFNHREIRRVYRGQPDDVSYILGMVASDQTIQSFSGHHANPMDIKLANDGVPRSLFVADEASSLPDNYFTMTDPWAKRKFIFGNPWDCENRFKHAVKGKPGTKDKGGDIKAPGNGHYYRKVIQIKAEHSPNVRYGKAATKLGRKPKIIIPGIKPYEEYMMNRELWDPIRQCICLDAEFYEGKENLMFPPIWLNEAEETAAKLPKVRKGETMGVDPAEGGDDTAWAIIDGKGIIELIAKKTPDTNDIPSETLALMQKYQIPPERVFFDRGGGGKEHADRLRSAGYNVKTVGFGETVTPPKKRGIALLDQRVKADEIHYVYKNRRAQMYGMLRLLIDPANEAGFGIPAEYDELRRQLAPIPLQFDEEGRLFIPPKNKRNPNDTQVTLTELLGCSPDQADALVLAVYGRQYDKFRLKLGVGF